MRKAIRRKLLWEKEFITLYVEIDTLSILNIQPLSCANSDDNMVICPVDFIQSNACIAIPTINKNRNEYMSGTLNTTERLIKY
ncbi:hypothetical protein LOAG_15988 [Loa loa]|uniref:Uncharacterized protein n=1 Tax=Loa loa TaxID=7209 RepID=A0A1S0TFN1_LOALO|nr:hypothetical protein LOAG_15988 [Loa loa]EFO12545.1 hypothetical protein LOAG_15988 [Loa loa]